MAQHYFASCPFGFATAPSRIEAIDKLINHFRTDLQTLTKNAQKDGLPGGYVWTCRVVGQEVKDYRVAWFQPVVKDLDGVTVDRPKEHYITYLTKTKRSLFDLTSEVQRQVDRQQKLDAENDEKADRAIERAKAEYANDDDVRINDSADSDCDGGSWVSADVWVAEEDAA